MHTELRQCARQPMSGMAALIADGRSMVGHLADISPIGVGLNIADIRQREGAIQKTWLCRVVSPELPRTVEFVLKVVRTHPWPNGYGIGCAIAAIDKDDEALLKAFHHHATWHTPGATFPPEPLH